MAVDTMALLAAPVTLGFALEATPLPDPFPGARLANGFVESSLGRNDVLLVPYLSDYSFAAESHFAPLFKAVPTGSLGFSPAFKDPRIHILGYHLDPEQVPGDVAHANRVLVYMSQLPLQVEGETALDRALVALGFQSEVFHFKDATVDVWNRRPGTISARPPP